MEEDQNKLEKIENLENNTQNAESKLNSDFESDNAVENVINPENIVETATLAESGNKMPENENSGHSGNFIPTVIVDEMKSSFLDYAMSVIVSRALPDVRDGLKPVHRRILFAMNEMGMFHDKAFKKSARIVGEVLGKYHPHGDSAVYDSMVRMAQTFSLRYPLIDGQGNFGSIDGDSAAAMRYTEARLARTAEELLIDIKKETVDFVSNFDDSLKEPSVLPGKLPNLLINGSSGIAVGMATNIPPHNLPEVVDGAVHLIDNPDCSVQDLMQFVKGPDFPTGGIIQGRSGILSAYSKGRGKVVVKARAEFEEKSGKNKIVFTEIPYMVNKSVLIQQIADLVRDKKVLGIFDIRDESDREGMRIVIDLKSNVAQEIVLNQLYKHSRLQTSFGIIMLALVDRTPCILNLKQVLENYIAHRQKVVRRRTEYDLQKAEKRKHILEGLIIALNNIDPAIVIIKESKSVEQAKTSLIGAFSLSDVQAQAILDMKLQRLTSLEQDKIRDEHAELLKQIDELKSILASEIKILDILKQELLDMKSKYGDARRTDIVDGVDEDIDIEDLIEEEEMVVTVSHSGYIKRVPLSEYKAQKRGGKGMIATTTREEDFVEHIFTASTHSYILFFTNLGKVYWLKVYNLPQGRRSGLGKAIVNLLNLDQNEKIKALVPVRTFDNDQFLLMATKQGIVKKTSLEEYSRPRKGGIVAINIQDGDDLIDVIQTSGSDQIILGTQDGMAIRFSENDVRSIGRSGKGVRGINLRKGDSVIGMVRADDSQTLLTVTENGYGKRTKVTDYRLISRAGVGVKNIICSERNGRVVSINSVDDSTEIMLISLCGIVIRIPAKDISVIGRNTQGLRLMRLNSDDKVVAAAKIAGQKEEQEVEEAEQSGTISDGVEISDNDLGDVEFENEEPNNNL